MTRAGKDDSPVVFLETAGERVSPVAARIKNAEKAADASTRVKVSPYRVVHEGEPFVGGNMLSVPNATAETWISAGWAEPVRVEEKS
jgi:hypothetical protein